MLLVAPLACGARGLCVACCSRCRRASTALLRCRVSLRAVVFSWARAGAQAALVVLGGRFRGLWVRAPAFQRERCVLTARAACASRGALHSSCSWRNAVRCRSLVAALRFVWRVRPRCWWTFVWSQSSRSHNVRTHSGLLGLLGVLGVLGVSWWCLLAALCVWRASASFWCRCVLSPRARPARPAAARHRRGPSALLVSWPRRVGLWWFLVARGGRRAAGCTLGLRRPRPSGRACCSRCRCACHSSL